MTIGAATLSVGPSVGLKSLATASAAGYTGATDATSGWAVPASSADWTSLLSGSGISNPSLLWLCQEASGSLADSIGTATATTAGAPTYANAVTGWTRKAVLTRGNTSDTFVSTSATLPTLGTTSFLALAIVRFPASIANTGPGSALTLGPTFGSQLAADGHAASNPTKLDADTNGSSASGGQTTNGTATYGSGSTVGVLLVQYNKTAGTAVVQTDQETLTAATVVALAGKGLALGGDNVNYWLSAGVAYLYVTAFFGAAAELDATHRASLIALLRNGH